MAFTTILRRSASTIVPLAARVIGGQRHAHHSETLFSAVKHTDFAKKTLPQNPSTATRLYSSSPSPSLKRPSSDEALIRLLDSEISLVEKSASVRAQEVPKGFPFHIKDNLFEDNLAQEAPNFSTIYLSREYKGETINVEGKLYHHKVVDDEADGNDEDIEKPCQSRLNFEKPLLSLFMIVRVSKKGGPSLEFHVGEDINIRIESLSIKDPEILEDQQPKFVDLAENLQNGFYKYLEIRGITRSTFDFLYEYMAKKYKRECRDSLRKCRRRYMKWLKNLKSFVEA